MAAVTCTVGRRGFIFAASLLPAAGAFLAAGFF
jgi:hypothetical protein